jgi:hypothetical protein
MRKLFLVLGTCVLFVSIIFSAAAKAEGNVTTLNFAVTRDGDRIGTCTVRLHRDGSHTIAEVATHIQVKIAFITVYRYEQRETERWIDGKLVAMNAVTDDNGTIRKVSATSNGDKLSVNADGKVSEVDPAVVPVSLWNPSLLRKSEGLDTQRGSIVPVSVVDHGKEELVLQGRPTIAHHYSIKTTFPQDVWYDEHQRLLKVELRGSDGSTIQYQLG